MGNCFGSEEAEVVEAVKKPGRHGHGQPQAAAATRSPHAMVVAPPSAQVTARSSPGSSMSSFTTNRSNSGSTTTTAVGGGAEPDSGTILEAPNLRIFTFAELRAATRNFKPDTLLGEGGFGQVYKGWVDERTMNPVRSGTGMVIAVKKLNQESVQGLQEWQSEVNFLGRISHPNLVRLLGYCLEDRELLLVYEFMAKGSLENHLFRKSGSVQPIPWPVGHATTDRHRRCTRPRLPPFLREARHLPRFQSLKHPPRHALQREAVRLRSGQGRSDGRRQPRDHAGDGHVRVRGAGVRGDGAPVREERRVRVRRGAAGDADGAAGARHGPAGAAAEPGGLGQAVPGGPAEAGPARGPAPGGAVPVQGRRAGRAADAELPRRRPQEPALHGRRPPRAPGDRAHAAAPPPRVLAGGARGQHVAADRWKERGARRAEAAAAPAAEGWVGRGAERPPVSSSEMTRPGI